MITDKIRHIWQQLFYRVPGREDKIPACESSGETQDDPRDDADPGTDGAMASEPKPADERQPQDNPPAVIPESGGEPEGSPPGGEPQTAAVPAGDPGKNLTTEPEQEHAGMEEQSPPDSAVSSETAGESPKPEAPSSDAGENVEPQSDESAEPQVPLKPSRPKKIFLVDSPKALMARDCAEFLQRLGFETVSFHYTERYKESIESRYEAHKDIQFALILLAAEEFAYPKMGKPHDARLRVSQGTVFEFGFLLGKLGRQNTFVLYYEQDNFLLPTDFLNVVYIPYNQHGEWRGLLVNRLRLCGYDIDEKIDFKKDYR